MAKHLWQKGESGNPAGRPPGSQAIKTQIQQSFLDQLKKTVPSKDGAERSLFDVFNENFFTEAVENPNSYPAKFVAERIYGQDLLDDIDAQVNKARREDHDFQEFRVYRRGFDVQQRVLLSQSKDIGLMCGRRAGKSETNKLKAIMVAATKDKQRVLIIGLTVEKTMGIYWTDMVTIIDELGVQANPIKSEHKIEFANGSFIQFGGNSNTDEREKFRGQHYDLVIIDEAQSQKKLEVLVREIVKPMLKDTGGVLMLTGSGPRTRGTYWESYYNNPSPSSLRLNWNMASNPHIKDYQEVLQRTLEDESLKETDPLFMREYLGLIVYDDDALVYRLTDDNFYTDDQMIAWMERQSPEDIKFTAGLDFGFSDSDAFVIIMYAEKSNEKWVVYEYKKSGTDVTTLCDAIKAGKDYIRSDSKFSRSYHRDFNIFADTSDQKISLELSHRYGIPVHNAVKYDKAMAIQNLQDECRKNNFRIKRGSVFEDEALRTIFARVEVEGQPSIITREIDDDVYHPDMMDAILYSLRHYWLTHSQDHSVQYKKEGDDPYQQQNEYLEQQANTRQQLF